MGEKIMKPQRKQPTAKCKFTKEQVKKFNTWSKQNPGSTIKDMIEMIEWDKKHPW
jgi:hypothetical protein